MIVKLNGNYWFDTDEHIEDELLIIQKSNKIKGFAFTLWTSSGILYTPAAHAANFYDSMKPLTNVFQDIALGLGILFSLAGFILLGFRKRWGETTLKTTGTVVLGVFLVPSILMLIAIVGTMLNEALTDAFENVRAGVSQ